jgi:hypothetical protein
LAGCALRQPFFGSIQTHIALSTTVFGGSNSTGISARGEFGMTPKILLDP